MKVVDGARRKFVICLAAFLFLWGRTKVRPAFASASDNAALLYYQASIKHYELEHLGSYGLSISLILRSTDPNDQLRKLLSHPACREVIKLVNAGTEMSLCEWGLTPTGKWMDRYGSNRLAGLYRLLSADARVFAADGQYRAGLETVLRLRRFARHIGDEAFVMWTTSLSADQAAFSSIQYILGVTPPDAETLTWLKVALARSEGPDRCPRRTLNNWRDIQIRGWQSAGNTRQPWKEAFLNRISDEGVRTEIQNLAEPDLLERARVAYDLFLESACEILESDVHYEAKLARIKKLIDRLEKRSSEGAPIGVFMHVVEVLDDYYRFCVNAQARVNAVKAALDVYLVRARTGRLSQSLPAGLPKDPYSGQDFEYERTNEGFLLRCRAKAVGYGEIRQFEFKVHGE